MFKSLIFSYYLASSLLFVNLSCSKSVTQNVSYGEMQKFRSERVYLLLASDVFATYASYCSANGEERITLTFQAMEANLQLNLVRIKHVLKTEKLSNQTRSILDQVIRDYTRFFKKIEPNFLVWNVKGKIYDLGEKEPILPRFYKIYDTLLEIN